MSDERQETLTILGFRNYNEYLKSDLWKTIRKLILERDAYYCRIRRCNNRAEQVHHFTYSPKTLVGRNPAGLISVCRSCHKKIEFEGKRKRTLKEAQSKMLEMVLGEELRQGKSSPRVGFWFRNQFQANTKVRNEMIKKCSQFLRKEYV